MAKKYIDKNVYDSAIERIEFAFNEFDKVLVAFSGGKDSGVMLNLCYEYAKKHKLLDKMAMYHLDYEAQYQFTTDYVTRCFSSFSEIEKYWLCLPVAADCGCRMTAGNWIPWNKAEKDIWAREMPKTDYLISEDNCPFEMTVGQRDYEVQDNFGKWFAGKYGKTAIMIGIRTDESLNRFRAIASEKKVHQYKNKSFVVGYGDDITYKCYPLYDWRVDDIWIANAKFGFDYNKLYDLFYQSGLSIDQMRVANPFHSCGTDALKLYKVIEPHTWGKLLSRINGVSFAGIYGGTTAMGWKSITKPKEHTWKSYCYFLLDTMDAKTKMHYKDILEKSIKFWNEKGGAISDETISELENYSGWKRMGKTFKNSTKEVISFKEYPDDLPEVTNFHEVPSYKRMCVCIMKNDYFCKYMGFSPTKEAFEKRRLTVEKYKNLL